MSGVLQPWVQTLRLFPINFAVKFKTEPHSFVHPQVHMKLRRALFFLGEPTLSHQLPVDMEDWFEELLHFSGAKRAADFLVPDSPRPKAVKFLGIYKNSKFGDI